jgi:hypothetical protein
MRRWASRKSQRALQNCFGLFPIRSFIGLRGEIKKHERYEDLVGCMLLVPAFFIIIAIQESGWKRRQSFRSSNAVLLTGSW